MLQASTSSVPQAPQKFTVQLFGPLSLLHLLWPVCRLLGQGSKVSLSVRVHHLRIDPGLQRCHQCSPNVNWAEPLRTQQTFTALCNGTVHCRFIFLCLAMVWHTAGIGLSTIMAKLYGCCCFLVERNHFMYDFAVSQWLADLLLTDGAESLSPAIGPTFSANFVVVGFKPPLQRGGPLCAGPTAVYRDKRVDLMVIADLLYWTRVWSLKNSQSLL